jgi:hypothetical protein
MFLPENVLFLRVSYVSCIYCEVTYFVIYAYVANDDIIYFFYQNLHG